VYRCQVCRRIVPTRIPQHRVVVETRTRTYPPRPKANRFHRERRLKQADDPGGRGEEIAMELVACPECFMEAEQPATNAALAGTRSPPYGAIA
jgi:hypothetical protein